MKYDDYMKYHFSQNTYNELKSFFEAKEKYIKTKGPDDLYWMQYWFLIVHSDFKAERVSRRISQDELIVLTEGLKEGL